jgi:pimeloyl-ACP methyl ester carboxylesterase
VNSISNIDSLESIILRNGERQFTALSAGSGPLVLLLHGFPDGPCSFRHQLTALAAAGYRAIAPTMRGYEPSSQGSLEGYHAADMASDAVAWLDQLGADRAHLIGHDWGSTIATAAASMAPERWHSLSLLSVPHPGRFQQEGLRVPQQLKNSWYLFFFQLRGFADWWVKRKNYAFLEYLWRKWSPNWAGVTQELPDLKRRFQQAGVLKASLQYYRLALDTTSPQGKLSRELLNGEIRIPTLGLTGLNDGCIKAEAFRLCMKKEDFPAGLSVELIDDAGHFLQLEQPQAVNRALLAWLRENDGSAHPS